MYFEGIKTVSYKIGSIIFEGVDYVAETVASVLGVTSPKFAEYQLQEQV